MVSVAPGALGGLTFGSIFLSGAPIFSSGAVIGFGGAVRDGMGGGGMGRDDDVRPPAVRRVGSFMRRGGVGIGISLFCCRCGGSG